MVSDVPGVDTRANILAASPVAGKVYISSDTSELFIGNGTVWKITAIILSRALSGIDIGNVMGRYEENYGYNPSDLAGKVLHNCSFGGYNTTVVLKEGAIRYDFVTLKPQMYTGGAWKNIIAWTDLETDDAMKWSDYVTYGKDIYGNDRIHGGVLDIGPFASEHKIYGGTF